MNRRQFFAASAITVTGGVARTTTPAEELELHAIGLFERVEFKPNEDILFHIGWQADGDSLPVSDYKVCATLPPGRLVPENMAIGCTFASESETKKIRKAAEETLIAAAENDNHKRVGPNPKRVRVGDRSVLVGKGAGCVMPVRGGKVGIMVLHSDCVAVEKS